MSEGEGDRRGRDAKKGGEERTGAEEENESQLCAVGQCSLLEKQTLYQQPKTLELLGMGVPSGPRPTHPGLRWAQPFQSTECVSIQFATLISHKCSFQESHPQTKLSSHHWVICEKRFLHLSPRISL